MLFKTRLAAFCLILLGTEMTWGQDTIRVVINFRGDVTITGTRNADNLRMVTFGVLGLVSENGTPLEVRSPDGVFSGTALLLPGTSNDSIVRFNLGDGDDRFELDASAKNVTGYLGRGDDVFTSEFIEVERDLIVDAGTGFDDISMQNVVVFRNVRLSLGAGNESIIEATVLSDCEVYGSCTLNQTSGGSYHILDDLFVEKTLRVTCGLGYDVIGAAVNTGTTYANLGPGVDNEPQYAFFNNSTISGPLTIIGGGDQDEFALEDSLVYGNTVMNSGTGDDEVELINSYIAGNVSLNTSSGDDKVVVRNAGWVFPSGNFTVNTGLGDDQLKLGTWDTRTFRAFLGSGNDTVVGTVGLRIDISTEIGVPYLNGGAGTDQFDAFNNPDSLNLISFEEGPPAT